MLSVGGKAVGPSADTRAFQILQRSTAPTAFRVTRGRLIPTAAATTRGDTGRSTSSAVGALEQRAAEDQAAWEEGGFPSYLQSEVDDFCAAWSDALQEQDGSGKHVAAVTNENPVWQAIRREARADAVKEPLLSSFYHASILSHDSVARSLAFVLANRLADATLLATELFEIFHSVLRENESILQAALLDIVAFYERDPACVTYSAALLYFKGFHAIQTHRIGHILWQSDRKVMALALQARMSEVLAIDIHPGAVLGKGLLLDHGTGVVIGETSRVGDNVSIMQNVTLGGTGKSAANRHPNVEANVLIGAGATVLGNITVGKGAQVAAGSLVLKDVPPKTMVAGSPARAIAKVKGNAALRMQQQIQQQPAESLHASSGRPTLPDPFSTAAPRPPAQQQPAHHQSGDDSGRGTQHAAAGSASAFALRQQSDSDDDCDDGSTTPHNAGNLADWVMSIATKPRQREVGSEGASSSNSSSNSSQNQPQQGQQQHRSAGQEHSGGSASSGGRSGIVAALAVQQEQVSTGPSASSGEPAVLQLAPREEDCEPDWMMSPASSASLAAYTMAKSARDTPAGATAVERGAEMWQAVHGGAAAADDIAALRRFNSNLLAEAGIPFEGSWSLPVLSVAATPGMVAPEPQASALKPVAMDAATAAEISSAAPVSAEHTDYVI